MIIITTQIADTEGVVAFDESPESTLGDWQARISCTKTLDGGVWLNHSGISDGDRILTIKATITKDQKNSLRYIQRNYQTVDLSCSEGFFSGSIYSASINNGELSMKFYVKEKLDG